MKKNFARLTPALALAMVFGFSNLSARAADDAAPKPAGTASIAVHVVDGDAKPVAGATVRLTAAAPAAEAAPAAPQAADTGDAKPKKSKKEKTPAIATGTTAEDGSVTLPNLPAGDYVVNAMLKGTGKGMEKVTLTDGQAATVTVTLKGKPKAQ